MVSNAVPDAPEQSAVMKNKPTQIVFGIALAQTDRARGFLPTAACVGPPFAGGHGVAGRPAPSHRWLLDPGTLSVCRHVLNQSSRLALRPQEELHQL
jgi:hypothetical protein